ncbi:MAG: D-alanine--D-alanine ligase [Paludibacteraceae bacterium]|nr:D-alanine--D-alanine ligase [Paludibacteraceae bacterium]
MKRKIAIVAGGYSSEWQVSMRSAQGIYSFLPKDRYDLCIVTIIGQQWTARPSEDEEYSIDKNDFSYINQEGKRIHFDFAYITIHGTPGENGLLQGYFEMINMPYSCCGVLPAAITFNKFTCNHYLQGFGINIARSILLRKQETIENERIINEIGLPCFIKTNVGGSSFGVTKVKHADDIQHAIQHAFNEGGEVIIESMLVGTELTCGAYKTTDKSVAFPITEVVTGNEFFDYDAKYNGQVDEITPARIPNEIAEQIQQLTLKIYDILACKGIIRVDYILSADNIIHLLEVNTTPGMTATSFIPQQVKAAGLEIGEVLHEIIENELSKHNTTL